MNESGGSEPSRDRGDASSDSELARALDDYYKALETGRPAPAEALASLRPELADRVAAHISILNLTRLAAPGLGEIPDASPTIRLGDFMLGEPIGRGGMGTVFEARQISLGRRVAVKVLSVGDSSNPVNVSRFQIEAQAAAKLRHPNIVPIFAVGCERGTHFYAMQLIEGHTLFDLIRELRGEADTTESGEPRDLATTEDGPPPTDSTSFGSVSPSVAGGSRPASRADHHRLVAEMGIQAAEALEHARGQGVIHRDIKPSNLMVDARGHLWVTDFGLARMAADSSLTSAGNVLGTLRYMSPEQASGDSSRVDHRTDVYSLGATLHELLTLRPVHQGRDRGELLHRVIEGKIQSLRAWDPSIPVDLETIILRALSRDPQDRHATAGDLAEDLRRFLDNRPILSRRPSLWSRAGRWSRRRWALVASMALVGALVLGAGFAIQSFVSRHRAEARANRLAAYVRDVNQASQHIRRNALEEAVAILARDVPEPGAEDLRTFPWRYYWRLAHVRPRVLEGHAGDVYSLKYAPDGNILATAGEDGLVRLWDPVGGTLIRVLQGHDDEVDCVVFSPDGRRLAAAGDDGSIRLWNLRGDEPSVLVGQVDAEVIAIAFAPEGRELISGDAKGRILFWDLETARPSREAPPLDGRVECLAVSPDGQTLAVASSDPGVRLIDLNDPRRATDLNGFQKARWVAFSPDGRLVAAGDQSGEVAIAALNGDATPRTTERLADLPHAIEGLAFSPNGRVLAACGREGHLRLLDAASGRVLRTYRTGRRRLWNVVFSPDGQTLAACGSGGAVELWDASVAQARETMLAPLSVLDAIPPLLDENSLTTVMGGPSGDLRLSTWSLLANRAEVDRAWSPPPFDVGALAPGGAVAALYRAEGDPPFQLVSTTGQDAPSPSLPSLEHPAELFPNQAGPEGAAMVFSADGSKLSARLDYRGVVVWDVATGRASTTILEPTAPHAIAFSPRGDRLALVYDNALRVLHLDTGATDFRPGPQFGVVGPVVFTPDGRKVAVGFPYIKTLAVWDLDAPQAAPTTLAAPDGPRALAVSPDGKTLASSGLEAGAVHLIDLTTLAPITTLDAPTAPARALHFSPDGATLLGLFALRAGAPAIVTAWTANLDVASPIAPIEFGGR